MLNSLHHDEAKLDIRIDDIRIGSNLTNNKTINLIRINNFSTR